MEELKPCPFCGGEADVSDEGKGTEPERYWAYCGNVNCFVEGTSAYATEREAIEAWNTRNDRTCHFNMSNPPTRGWYCSECHVYISDEAMADATTWLKPKFCPNCGAEVK